LSLVLNGVLPEFVKAAAANYRIVTGSFRLRKLQARRGFVRIAAARRMLRLNFCKGYLFTSIDARYAP